MRLLLVDDDAGVRALLRATLEGTLVELEEVPSAEDAAAAIARRRPDAVVLDVELPGRNGLDLCAELKADESTRGLPVVLLSGGDLEPAALAAAGADAFLAKPFSPLELLDVVERVAGGEGGLSPPAVADDEPREQLLLYARDLRHLLEVERSQRRALEHAYRETVRALAGALEARDTGTEAHSQRVLRYASVLAETLWEGPVDEAAEYGFLLHDVGKIGIPDAILLKPGPLGPAERRLMETHTILGAQLLRGVSFLGGECVRIVRSHHERWDGRGYPDGLAGEEIPLGARIFALADTLDAITSDRPYRRRRTWDEARRTILAEAGGQFDPAVVRAFEECEEPLLEAAGAAAG